MPSSAKHFVNRNKPVAIRSKLTPPQIAQLWGVGEGKILDWIKNGELRAIDASTRRGGRPRYLVDVDDLAVFEERRSVVPAAKPCPKTTKGPATVTPYF
jgi:hypothetical protein